MQEFDTDILIAGGGLAGATLALAISHLVPGYRVTVAETFPLAKAPASEDYQPSYDARSTALAWGSRLIFERLGLWQAISTQAEPIGYIHVSEKGRFGTTRLSAEEHGQPALGYVADNRWLGLCLMDALGYTPGIQWLAPAQVTAVKPLAIGVEVSIDENGHDRSMTARCLVVADGGRSGLRESLGIGVHHRDYGQHALIANIRTERPHKGAAWERFARSGPLALLPLHSGPQPGHRAALVWTLSPEGLAEVLALDEEQKCARLQEVFGWRLGRFTHFGEAHHYPLSLTTADECIRPSIALVGNAAHALHPVAGQGFNLALRGLMALVEAFRFAQCNGLAPGDLRVLTRYQRQHESDQRQTIIFSDSLVRLFGEGFPGVGAARNAGLVALDATPAARRWFSRRAMGLTTGSSPLSPSDRDREHWQ